MERPKKILGGIEMTRDEFRTGCAIAHVTGKLLLGFPFATAKGLVNACRKGFDCGLNGEKLTDEDFMKAFKMPLVHLIEKARQTAEQADCIGVRDLGDLIKDLRDFKEEFLN
jgi:hypothetical protein